MAWARWDDTLYDNGKVLSFSARAFRLWACSISYAARHRTDGKLSPDQAGALFRLLRCSRREADELVAKGGWERDGDGYAIHDFLEFNPTAEELEAVRRARAEAGRRGGRARRRSAPAEANEANPQAIASKQTRSKTKHMNMYVPSRPVPAPPAVDPGTPEQGSNTGGETCASAPARVEPPGFGEFWRHYPRRENRVAALEAFGARLRKGAEARELVEAACHLAEYVQREGTELRYVPHAHRFLRDERDREFAAGPPVPTGQRTRAGPRRQTLLEKLALLDDDEGGDDGDPE